MQKLYRVFATVLVATSFTFGQYAIRGDVPFGNGFNFGANPSGGIADRVLDGEIIDNTRRRRAIITSGNSGDRFFRLVTNSGGGRSEVGPSACAGDVDITSQAGSIINGSLNCTNGAFKIGNTVVGERYVFITPQSDNSSQFLFFRFTGQVQRLSSVTQSIGESGDDIAPGQPVTITAQITNGGFNGNGQGAYLRYSVEDQQFGSARVVPMTANGGSVSATIPAIADGETVYYYVFTSDASVDFNTVPDVDVYTVTINNGVGTLPNNQVNYRYTADASLPVTLAGWRGQRKKNDVFLTWSTSAEDNAAHFGVECSEDGGLNWSLRTRVPARNLSTGGKYDYLDQAAPAGNLHYRLRQVDHDGSFEYSPVINVAPLRGVSELRVWPQPATQGGLVNFSVADQYTGGRGKLISLTGRTLYELAVTAGNNRIDTANLPAGIYLLRIDGDKNSSPITTRIVVN